MVRRGQGTGTPRRCRRSLSPRDKRRPRRHAEDPGCPWLLLERRPRTCASSRAC